LPFQCANLSTSNLTGQYHHIVEADIKSYFNNIDRELLLEMLAKRIDDKPFLNHIRKWLKAGILETDGQVIHPIILKKSGGSGIIVQDIGFIVL
jgi:retron-type reverse transcriptase